MSNDQRVSSRGLWRTFQVQSPSRLGKARLYLASRQPVELPIPPSTHLLRKSSQIQGFITRMKAEPYDQIAGDCCDLLSSRVKEWQSHRGALVVKAVRESSTSLRLDYRPGTLPGQWDKGANTNSALNSNNEAQSPSSAYYPSLRFSFKAKSTPASIPLRQSLTLSAVLYQQVVRSVSTGKASMRRAHRLV